MGFADCGLQAGKEDAESGAKLRQGPQSSLSAEQNSSVTIASSSQRCNATNAALWCSSPAFLSARCSSVRQCLTRYRMSSRHRPPLVAGSTVFLIPAQNQPKSTGHVGQPNNQTIPDSNVLKSTNPPQNYVIESCGFRDTRGLHLPKFGNFISFSRSLGLKHIQLSLQYSSLIFDLIPRPHASVRKAPNCRLPRGLFLHALG